MRRYNRQVFAAFGADRSIFQGQFSHAGARRRRFGAFHGGIFGGRHDRGLVPFIPSRPGTEKRRGGHRNRTGPLSFNGFLLGLVKRYRGRKTDALFFWFNALLPWVYNQCLEIALVKHILLGRRSRKGKTFGRFLPWPRFRPLFNWIRLHLN
ncbi:MAG: hypothetical protein A3J79_07140 [Elusimicrobia bacterium RIFOXYB2_FULL_62_6]|nr:MAG: hypothetical protein A3J79_07140 [Elusimicrobia bacterium RIFOXYB2_FULL_62_6]